MSAPRTLGHLAAARQRVYIVSLRKPPGVAAFGDETVRSIVPPARCPAHTRRRAHVRRTRCLLPFDQPVKPKIFALPDQHSRRHQERQTPRVKWWWCEARVGNVSVPRTRALLSVSRPFSLFFLLGLFLDVFFRYFSGFCLCTFLSIFLSVFLWVLSLQISLYALPSFFGFGPLDFRT